MFHSNIQRLVVFFFLISFRFYFLTYLHFDLTWKKKLLIVKPVTTY